MAAQEFLDHEGTPIAYRRIEGSQPGVVWLGGYRSDMLGAKAETLAAWAERTGRAFLRHDYSGHGESGGDFADGTISKWLGESLAVFRRLTEGPQLLVGSSMGAWIALRLVQELRKAGKGERIAGIVLLAPAPDFTEKLMTPEIPPEGHAALTADGVWLRPSEYGAPYPITRALLEDGARWSILGGEPIPLTMPIRILQGAQDPDVPWQHALELAQTLKGEDVVFSLIKDGDHRLSRPQDIDRLIAAVEELG